MRKFKGGGSSVPQPSSMTQQTSNLPDYVEPYYKRLLQRGEAESLQGYTPYGGKRLEYFSPDELTSQAMVRGFGTAGTPQEFTDASKRYGDQGSIAGEYTAGDVSSGYQAGAMGPGFQGSTYGSGYQAGAFDPGYQAGAMGPGYQGANYGSDYQAGAFDPGYQAQLRDSQYQVGQGPAGYAPEQYEENIQRFMSPYQQNVTDIQKREAIRQSGMAANKIQDAASSSGGLGGYREAIMQSERERGLSQQLGDIQQRGSQAAFESAQQQLERERGASMGAAQFGLQRFGALEQAGQSQEQMAQQAFNAGQSARQQAAQMGMTAQQQEDAARQAQEKFGQSAFGQTQQAMQAAGSQGIQSYQAGEQARQAAGSQGIQAYQVGEQARQQAAQMGMTAQQQEDAARQAQEKFSQSAFGQTQQSMQTEGAQQIQSYQAGESARQQAAQLGLSAEQIEQAGKQAEEKFRQSGYDLSSRYNLSAAQGLMQSGQGIQQDAISRMQMLENIGRQQRALRQASLDMGYQDFVGQRDFTQQQLGGFSNLLRGVPVQPQQTISTYQQQPGLFQTAVGAGLSGLGLYRGMGGN